MSAVIQRRRVHTKVSKLDAKQPSIYEPNTFRYRQYLTTFNNFENNFNKNFLEGNLKGLKSVLLNFHKSFKKNELLLNDLCNKHTDAKEQNNDNVFLIQRSNKLVNFLLDYFLNKKYIIIQNKSQQELCPALTQENQDVIILTVKILKAFAMVNPVFGQLLAHWPMFIETLLSLTLQNYKLYFKQTLRILEALVRYNPGAITQDMYPLILDMISSLPKKHLARFSRIIALVLLENSNKIDFNELSLGYSENKTSKMHSLLLSTPNFLESYVFTLESLKQTIKSLTSINSDNLSKTLSYLKESGLIKNSAVDLRALKPIFEQCKTVQNLISEVFASDFIIKFAVSKSNITEILYIISSLLAGRRRIDVQDQLNQLDFFNRVLDPFFEILFHPSLQLEDPEDPSNANNPLSTARIQFIRVLANFCERSSPRDNLRDLLLTEEEKALLNSEIKWDQVELQKSSSLFTKESLKQNLFGNVSNKGLLQKIIEVLKKINPNTSYYTWLCSCLETFLRGSNRSYQVFVAHTGLLSHLLEKLIKSQVTVSSNIQATYDLIAEIFKYNTYNILFLEKLCESFGWRSTLLNFIQRNVVNSNVFLRSVILSYERIRMTEADKQVKIEDYLSLFNTLLNKKDQLMSTLFQAVVSESITKDNLCCLNTVLTTAIFAEQEGTLQTYINRIIGKGLNKKCPKEQTKEFGKKLNTWLQYYLSNTQARFVLESTTSVKFVYFQDIMEKIQILFKEQI